MCLCVLELEVLGTKGGTSLERGGVCTGRRVLVVRVLVVRVLVVRVLVDLGGAGRQLRPSGCSDLPRIGTQIWDMCLSLCCTLMCTV